MLLSMTELLINATMIVSRGHKLIISSQTVRTDPLCCRLTPQEFQVLMKANSGISKEKCTPFEIGHTLNTVFP